MCMLSDQALDQWNSLVEREENEAYKVQPPSTASPVHSLLADESDALHSACPAAWREKICEWCFYVVDEW